jgi:AcrR family transcriptional regulator
MPRETLTRDQIVAAAVKLLDAEGLEGFNMRSLGKRLHSAATAVYWHVGNKANLIGLAGDQVWSEIALPDLTEADWRTAATSMATDVHAMLTRHTWLVQAFGSYLTYGPGKARHDDHALAVCEAGGFRGAQIDQAVAAVFTFVLGNALGPAAQASLTRRLSLEGPSAELAIRETMAKAADVASGFPRLRERLGTAAADYSAAPEDTFEFGLEAMLDGLETRLPSRRRKTQPVRPHRPRTDAVDAVTGERGRSA